MPAPTFLCIGAQKAGTTWLATAACQHPEVCCGKSKEIHFFDREDAYLKGLGWYEGQFECEGGARSIGEFTPNYLWTVGDAENATRESHWLGAADRISEAYPDLRLVVMLRHPVDRAVSGFNHDVNRKRVHPTMPLLEAIAERPGIREYGRYVENLEAWLDCFPRDRFLFLVYEEDVRPPTAQAATVARAFDHIGVDPTFKPDGLSARRNSRRPSFHLRRKHAHPLVNAAMALVPRALRDSAVWDLPDDISGRRALWDEYEPGIKRLEKLVGRSLPWTPPVPRTPR